MKQVIVTDISCFTFSDLENRDSHKQFTCRANMPFNKTLSSSVTQLHNFKKQIAVSPCGAFFLNRMRYLPEEMLWFVIPPSVWTDKWCRSLAVQDLNECLSEFDIEGGVYDGIYSTIHVAQPSESIIHLGGDLAFCAVGVQDMSNEKWQPTYDEYTWGEMKKIKLLVQKQEKERERGERVRKVTKK